MPAKNQTADIPTFVTAATVAGFTGLAPARITQLLQEGKIPKPTSKGHYLFRECVLAIVEDLRGRKADKPGAADIQRKNKADADSAELDAARKADETILKSDMQTIAADYALQVRHAIEQSGLPVAQEKRLISAIAKIELEKPEDEE